MSTQLICDPGIRVDFIECVFAYHRLKEFFAQEWTIASLIDFHRRHKWQLLAHSEPKYRELGRIVARAKRLSREDCERRYREGFMRAMRCRTSVSRHTNVLQHTAGFFRGKLDASERRRLNGVIEDYRDGIVPLVVPITLMRHLAEGQGITYLTEQVYFDPHPKELSLRNYV